MPVCDGFESTRLIRKREQQQRAAGGTVEPAKIVAFTGLASQEDQRRAFDAGVDHFVTKPLRFQDFKRILKACAVIDTDTPS